MIRRKRNANDEGVALVAAIAVALIGTMVATIVVSQAVLVTRDAQRDAVRTSEVHAAEAAIDATLRELSSSAPCPTPSFGTTVVGSGANAVQVVTTISYADGATSLACSGGKPVGSPDVAVIKAVSTPVNGVYGIMPRRVVEARVELVPRVGESAAIFTGGDFSQTGAGFTLNQSLTGEQASVWVDSGNFVCNDTVNIHGDLTVVSGTTTLSNANCIIEGHLHSGGMLTIKSKAAGTMIGDGITVSGAGTSLTAQQKNIKVTGDIVLAGSLVQGAGAPAFLVTAGSVKVNQVVAPAVANGLPQINFNAADWPTFTIKNAASFRADVAAASTSVGRAPQGWFNQAIFQECFLQDYMFQGSGQVTIPLANGNTVYNLMDCTNKKLETRNITFSIKGDLTIFAHTFSLNNFKVTSGDGLKHQIRIVVPYSYGAGYVSGGIDTDSGTTIAPPVELFMYTPKTLVFYNSSTTYGQLYAGKIETHPTSNFTFAGVGFPNVNLATTTALGFKVTLVSKRETS